MTSTLETKVEQAMGQGLSWPEANSGLRCRLILHVIHELPCPGREPDKGIQDCTCVPTMYAYGTDRQTYLWSEPHGAWLVSAEPYPGKLPADLSYFQAN